MIKIDPAVLFILGEVILALIVVMVGLIVFIARGRKREKDSIVAAEELRGHIRSNTPERQEWFQQILTECIVDSDVEVNRELATGWVEKEVQFYTQLLNMYLKRDAVALRGFDKQLQGYTSAYHELIALIRTRIDEERDSIPDEIKQQLAQATQESERLAGAVLTLEQENQRLNSELLALNSEMDQAMREYSVAFRPGSGMTGSDLPAAPVAPAAAVVATAAVVQVSEAVPVTAAPEPLPEDMEPDLEELGAEILAESDGDWGTDELEAVAEMEMAEPSTVLGDEWAEAFNELPDGEEEAFASSTAAAKGPVIDLADDGDIVLPQLNELMAAIDITDATDADASVLEEVEGDLLSDGDLPILDESVELDEDGLLAQLEGLDDIDMPSLSDALSMDELTSSEDLPAKATTKPPKV